MPEAIDSVLVVPCYNEARRFREYDFSQALEKIPTLGLLFVDDGSRDETGAVIRSFVAKHPTRVELLSLPENRGKAEAVREGIKRTLDRAIITPWSARSISYIGYWDADLATPFTEYGRFLTTFDEKPELLLVMGARVNLLGRSIQRHLHRHYLGRVFATAASMVLRLPVYDTQCGAKVFRCHPDLKALFDKPFISGWIFDVELLARLSAYLQRRGRRPHDVIYELPLLNWKDVEGSNIKPRDFFKALVALLRIAQLYPRPDYVKREVTPT